RSFLPGQCLRTGSYMAAIGQAGQHDQSDRSVHAFRGTPRCVNPLSCRGFTVPGGFCWCLLQGERDGGAEQGEGLPLHGGGGDDLVDLLAADGDGVAGEGGQVVDQVAEAVGGLPGGGGLVRGLVLGGGGAGGGGDGVVPGGRVLVGVGEWRPGLAQVPGQVAGEQADQHVAA